jgi:hypothetical protein
LFLMDDGSACKKYWGSNGQNHGHCTSYPPIFWKWLRNALVSPEIEILQTKWACSTLHCNWQGYDARSQKNARNIEVVMDKTMVIVLRILLYFENDLEMLWFHRKLRWCKPSEHILHFTVICKAMTPGPKRMQEILR